MKFFPTIRADFSDETLGTSEKDRRTDEERFDSHIVEPGNGTGGIVGVQGGENLVTCESGFDGDIGGFVVANFADHNDVGILAEDGAESIGKAETDFGFNGDLINSGELVFDGIFDGDDIILGVVQFAEHGVEGGGFAGAGWAGDEDHSVGGIDGFFENAEGIFIHTEGIDGGGEGAFIEEADDNFLPINCGQDGDTEVDFLSRDTNAKATILGEAALGDIETGEDFNSGDDGELEGFWGGAYFD